MEKEIAPEEIIANFNRFRSLCESLGDRAQSVLKMVDELGDRLALCPASASTHKHNAFSGGLIEHSLRVLKNLSIMNKAFKWNLPEDSMIIVALFHDIGKVGYPGEGSENDFYIGQKDDWRKNKLGEVYAYNRDILYMTTGDRTMHMLQHYGVALNREEYVALKTSDGFLVDENKAYGLKAPKLAIAVQTADYISTCDEGKNW